MTMFATKKGALQQYTVQYNITGALDRNSPAPAVTGAPDEEGVYQVDVAGDLGIIDPDFMGGVASRGDRFMVLLRLETAIPMGAGFFISTVDATGSVPSLSNIVELVRITPVLTGLSSFILTECVSIPQGQALTVGPLAAPPPGTFHRLTIEVRASVSADDEARLAKGCCCSGGGETAGDGGDGDGDVTEDLPFGFKITGLAASRTGAVATTTLLFSGDAVGDLGLPVAAWCQQVNDANAGTTFQITLQGKYAASLSLLNQNNDVGQAATIGVSVDATVAQQSQTPVITQSSVRATSGQSDDNFPSWIHCTAEFFVTDEMIAAGLGIVRAQVGPSPSAVLTLAQFFCGLVMVRLGDARLPT